MLFSRFWPQVWHIMINGVWFVCVTSSRPDSTICKWSPVQYPVYSLCEAGSQRDGKIAYISSPARRKLGLCFALDLSLYATKSVLDKKKNYTWSSRQITKECYVILYHIQLRLHYRPDIPQTRSKLLHNNISVNFVYLLLHFSTHPNVKPCQPFEMVFFFFSSYNVACIYLNRVWKRFFAVTAKRGIQTLTDRLNLSSNS